MTYVGVEAALPRGCEQWVGGEREVRPCGKTALSSHSSSAFPQDRARSSPINLPDKTHLNMQKEQAGGRWKDSGGCRRIWRIGGEKSVLDVPRRQD